MARADIFSSGKIKTRKSSNEAPESVVRKIGMIVELLRHQRIALSRYAAQYERDYRSFQRDLQQLRKIGVHASGGQSLGADDDFFAFATPQLIEGSTVADVCATLYEAQSSPDGRAAVRFSYHGSDGKAEKEREVEPYRVTFRSGAFYLIGTIGEVALGGVRARSLPFPAGKGRNVHDNANASTRVRLGRRDRFHQRNRETCRRHRRAVTARRSDGDGATLAERTAQREIR